MNIRFNGGGGGGGGVFFWNNNEASPKRVSHYFILIILVNILPLYSSTFDVATFFTLFLLLFSPCCSLSIYDFFLNI